MARRQRLSETQIAELFDPPTEQRELVRHLHVVGSRPGSHRALPRRPQPPRPRPHASATCAIPAAPLRVGERPPAALLAFVAEQIGVFPDAIDDYLATERNRQRHAIECQEQLGLRHFGKRAAAELAATLLPQAMEDDRLAHLAALVMQTCRQRRIICRRRAHLNGSAPSSATRPAGKCIAG